MPEPTDQRVSIRQKLKGPDEFTRAVDIDQRRQDLLRNLPLAKGFKELIRLPGQLQESRLVKAGLGQGDQIDAPVFGGAQHQIAGFAGARGLEQGFRCDGRAIVSDNEQLLVALSVHFFSLIGQACGKGLPLLPIPVGAKNRQAGLRGLSIHIADQVGCHLEFLGLLPKEKALAGDLFLRLLCKEQYGGPVADRLLNIEIENLMVAPRSGTDLF